MNSVWSDKSKLKHFEPLKGDIKTDVLVIGGGMAGILIAYMLKSVGVECVVAEAEEICSKITKNTTAKITSQHGLVYRKLIKDFGTEKTQLYFEANQKALKKYRDICRNIDCDFETVNSAVYSTDNREIIEEELKVLNEIGAKADLLENLDLPFTIAGAVRFKDQAQFNPFKFVSAITEGISIYEHTKVIEIRDGKAIIENGSITAEKIVVATHFPFINKHGSYFLKMYQERSYVLGLENAQKVDGMYVDEKDSGLSFRNYKNLLLLGGNSHRTGKQSDGWKMLFDFAKKHYPGSNAVYRFATQDCMTLDSIPYIGHYSKNTPNLYVATGFNKWGMTSSMVSAVLLTDMIIENDNPYTELFSPSRTILRPQLAINAFESAKNLLSPTKKRCPHLGCALKWNPNERSWDCPCHGSRFTENGELIDNPATGNIDL